MINTDILHLARCGTPLCIDEDTRDNVVARRNILFGLWAARAMDLPTAEQEAYAWSVHFADYAEPGHDDVVAKVLADLRAHEITITERRLRQQLHEMHLRALMQTGATD